MNKGVQKIFSEVPKTYELINHILTLGFDILWRRKAAKTGIRAGGSIWIDVCTGTGETVRNLSALAKNKNHIFAADFSLPMLAEAISKSKDKSINFVASDIQKLPFDDNTFDLVTISFATRNINLNRATLTQCLIEFLRILKPGGLFVNLETSQPSLTLIRKLFHLYIRIFIKPIGVFISGSKKGYAYLSHTIPRFYPADELADILLDAGFVKVEFERMFFGIAAIHKGIKK
jgi:demethylmenaquinone methyltransferase / 2-methoxy-6-polyprenyl-1,4-benzoquinol methylase